MKRNLPILNALKTENTPITALTCYDYSFARVLDQANVDIFLVGDSLGEVIQGHHTTIPVKLEHIIYHTQAVARARTNAWLIADMPFMSYRKLDICLENAALLMQAGAEMVKLEGGEWLCESIHALAIQGIPVCGHLGLTPQAVHKLGGYKMQAKTELAAEKLLNDALALEQAGADLLVLECIPAALAKQVSERLTIPTIGIGSGPFTNGQILVIYDLLGISDRNPPKFVKQFLDLTTQQSLLGRVQEFVEFVKQRQYPLNTIAS